MDRRPVNAVRCPRRLLLAMLLLLFPVPGALTRERYLDKPLFDFNAGKNRLPFGEYRLLRSQGRTTQVMISERWHTLILYTDRDNRVDSDIFSSSYSRFSLTPVEHRELGQVEFDRLVETILRSGDRRAGTTCPYPGLEELVGAAAGGAPVTKEGMRYIVESAERDRSKRVWMGIDVRELNCRIQFLYGIASPAGEILHPVSVIDSEDRRILRVLREYVGRLYAIAGGGG